MRIIGFDKAPAPADPRDDEAACRLVSSHGLLKCCDVCNAPPDAAARRWPRRLLRRHRPGGTIYLHAEAAGDFAARALRGIGTPFVLVSGDTTKPVGPEGLGSETFRAIAEHPQLIRWFAQNAAAEHPKLAPMPLGLDYHTLSAGRKKGWGPQASPRAQEDLLTLVRQAVPPLEAREMRGYCNWHFAAGVGGRAAAIEALSVEAAHYETGRVSRLESWQTNARFAFTISPPGRGMDCHRHWEAILLGAAPVMLETPVARLFRDLPCVIVRDWAAVTPDLLRREAARIRAAEFDFAPLLLEHWRRRMRGAPAKALRMRYAAFLSMTPEALHAAYLQV